MKKFISLVLALVMALSLTTVAWGAGVTYYVSATGDDAAAGTTDAAPLKTIEAALAKADVEKIVLLSDVTAASTIEITKNVTIDLGTKTVTGTGSRLFRITQPVTVTFMNGFIVNNVSGGRCIETRTGGVTLNLNSVTLTATSGASQPLTVGGNADVNGNHTFDAAELVTVSITGSTITAGTGYAITTFNPVEMTIANNSTVSGYAALNIKVADGSLGSAGSTFDVVNSDLIGTNSASEHPSNAFSTVMVEDSDVTINIDADSSVTATETNANSQCIFGFGNEYITDEITGSAVNVADGAELNGTILGINDQQQSIAGKTVTVPAEYADELVADGYVVTVDANGQVVAAGVSAPAPVGSASVTAKSYKLTSNGTLMVGNVNATFSAAVAATLNDDGKQTNTADISHYTFEGMNCVVTTSLADADIVLYSDAAGKNVMMYLKVTVTSYDGTGTVYTNFGKSCGQVTYTAEAGKTYYTTNANGDAGIYVADKEGTKALMVGGKLVLVKAAPVAYTTAAVKHAAVPTVKDGKVIGYTCATCKLAAIEAPNYMSIPKGAEIVVGNWYFPAVAVQAPATDKVESAETFDAGIAMYVGMSVMAAAGSAVVLKKKD